MSFGSFFGGISSLVGSIIGGSAQKSVARSEAQAVRASAEGNLEVAKEQTKQLEKQLAFEKESLESSKETFLKLIDIQNVADELDRKTNQQIASQAIEVQERSAEATAAAAVANKNAAIINSSRLKTLAPAAIGVLVLTWFLTKK